MSVKILKLASGEEVMGQEVVPGTRNVLTDVAQIFIQPADGGQIGVALVPYSPYAEGDEFEFANALILASYKPNEQLLNQYSKQFGSGIEVVGADVLNG